MVLFTVGGLTLLLSDVTHPGPRGHGGAVAEAIFLAVPVVVFLLLSRWSKRKARRSRPRRTTRAESRTTDRDGTACEPVTLPPRRRRCHRFEAGRGGAVAVVAAGCAALLARPWLVRLPVDPVALLVALFVVLGVVGAAWPLPAAGRRRARGRDGSATARRPPGWPWASGWGPSASGGCWPWAPCPSPPSCCASVALNSLAAVAEEAFFRRFAYGLAAARGPAVAVVASAAVFAAVHVTVWGWAVLPLDLAAGLVLGWQRWASGRLVGARRHPRGGQRPGGRVMRRPAPLAPVAVAAGRWPRRRPPAAWSAAAATPSPSAPSTRSPAARARAGSTRSGAPAWRSSWPTATAASTAGASSSSWSTSTPARPRPPPCARLKADGVDIVLGTYGSTISAPAAATAAREDMLLWETGAVGEVTRRRRGRGRASRSSASPPRAAAWARPRSSSSGTSSRPSSAPTADALRYAVAYVDDAYGRAVGLGAVHEVERGGGVMAGAFPYDVHRLDDGGAADLVAAHRRRPARRAVRVRLPRRRGRPPQGHPRRPPPPQGQHRHQLQLLHARLRRRPRAGRGGPVRLRQARRRPGAGGGPHRRGPADAALGPGPLPRPLPRGDEPGRPVRLRQRLGPGGPRPARLAVAGAGRRGRHRPRP